MGDKICIITDNSYLFSNVKRIVEKYEVDFFYSFNNLVFLEKFKFSEDFLPINLKECSESWFNKYNLFISLHCKQMFPNEMVSKYRCINVHPGLNPFNRGWFPQVFSIINGLPVGVTIHEMDEELDHGPIILQKEIKINQWETSYDVYMRILKLELELLEKNIDIIIKRKYKTKIMNNNGNINMKKDFNRLCVLDLKHIGSLEEHINLLRALTFQGYDNAYFITKDEEKVYVSIILKQFSNI